MTDRVTMDQLEGYWSEPPEGYERVASLELRGEPYEFDIVLIVKHDGELRWFFDSGCSCPIPFEGLTFDDGDPDLGELWTFLEERQDGTSYTFSSADVVDLKRKVLGA